VIQLVLFLALGLAFLFLLYFFARRANVRPEGGAEALLEARQALNSLQSDLLPAGPVERIFVREDFDFVSASCSREIRELFLRERKKLALCWIRHVRTRVLSLQRFYSGQSRHYAQLDLRTEVALGLSFASLLLACRILQVMFYLRGPYAAPQIVARAVGVAGNVCTIFEQSLSFLFPGTSGLPREGTARRLRGLD
jgi:hypothetical protein